MNVAVVGSLNLDLSARVDRFPAPGETVLGHRLTRGLGGKGANQAVAAARAGGAAVWLVGSVGADTNGDDLLRDLLVEGVRTDGILREQEPTGTALITVDSHGENCIVVVAGANGLRHPIGEAQFSALRHAEVLLAQLEVPIEIVADSIEAFRGRYVVLNAAPVVEGCASLLPLVDVLVVNEVEALSLASAVSVEDAVQALANIVPALVVTLGARGAIVVQAGRTTMVPAVSVTPVDTTGAGDTFCGVLAAALARGVALHDAVVEGSVAGALCVQRYGASVSIPDRPAVESLLRELLEAPAANPHS